MVSMCGPVELVALIRSAARRGVRRELVRGRRRGRREKDRARKGRPRAGQQDRPAERSLQVVPQRHQAGRDASSAGSHRSLASRSADAEAARAAAVEPARSMAAPSASTASRRAVPGAVGRRRAPSCVPGARRPRPWTSPHGGVTSSTPTGVEGGGSGSTASPTPRHQRGPAPSRKNGTSAPRPARQQPAIARRVSAPGAARRAAAAPPRRRSCRRPAPRPSGCACPARSASGGHRPRPASTRSRRNAVGRAQHQVVRRPDSPGRPR